MSLLNTDNNQQRGNDVVDFAIRELSVAREMREDSVFRDEEETGSEYSCHQSESSYVMEYSEEETNFDDPKEDEFDRMVTRSRSKSTEKTLKAAKKGTKATKPHTDNTRSKRTTRAH